LGAIYLTGIQMAVTFALLFVGIYVMAQATNSTAVQCIPCDGNLSVSEQVSVNAASLAGVSGFCMNGVAGTNKGCTTLLMAAGTYYVGSAFGLLNLVLWQWLLAYIFQHREEPETNPDASHVPLTKVPSTTQV